ncbi:hypothetical protein NMG60_11029135 [Bertholletia excelsa]
MKERTSEDCQRALGESAQLKQVFDFFDANGDGKISPPELRRVLLKLGREESAAAEEAEGMVREMDRDGDGLVDVDEFMSVVSGGNGSDGSCGGREEDLKDAFLVFDYDGNGFISAGELQRVLLSLGHRDCSLRKCQKMIKGVDRDGNGLVDFEEFRWMMTGGRCKS